MMILLLIFEHWDVSCYHQRRCALLFYIYSMTVFEQDWLSMSFMFICVYPTPTELLCPRPWHWTVATTGPGGQWIIKSTGPPKNPLAPPPKTCNHPNVFAAGIYDFTREVAHFCTLGLYITKNKYELTLPSEFCRFPVKIMAAYEALKKKKNPLAPLGQWKVNCGGPNWLDSLKKACGPAGT